MSQAVVDSSPVAEANVDVAVFALVIRGSAEAGATDKFADVGSVLSLTAPACILPAGESLKRVGEGGGISYQSLAVAGSQLPQTVMCYACP